MRRRLFAGVMSAALLGGSYTIVNAETTTLLAAMSVQPDVRRTIIIDTFIGALIAAGVWTKIDVMWVLAAHDEQAGRLNWKSPGTFTLTAVNSPTFTTDRGFAGNGSTSYLDTGWDRSTNAVQLTQNNAHASVYQRTQAGNNIEVISTASAAGLTLGGSTAASDSGSSRLNTNTRVTPALSGTLPQQRMSRRNASTDVSIVSDGVQILAPTAAASSALNNSDIYIGRRDTVYTASQVAGLSIGAYFDDTEALAFYNAWHNYMVAVGADT